MKSTWQLFPWMVLSLHLSDVSSRFDSGYSFLAGIPQKRCDVPLSASLIRRHMMSICHIPNDADLVITWLRWSWPGFSTVKLMFSPLKLIKDTLRLCRISCFSWYFHLLLLSFGPLLSHWSNEVHRMRSEFWNFHSQGSLYSTPYCSMDLIFWKIFVHQTSGISQGICDSFSYYTFVTRVYCIVHSPRQGPFASLPDAQSRSECQPQSKWSTDFCQRTESDCQSQLIPRIWWSAVRTQSW